MIEKIQFSKGKRIHTQKKGTLFCSIIYLKIAMLCPWICGVDNGERERAEGDTIIDYCIFVWTNHSRSSSSKEISMRNTFNRKIKHKNPTKWCKEQRRSGINIFNSKKRIFFGGEIEIFLGMRRTSK